MITVLFLIFLGLVIFHFWWDAIITPSVRLEMRYKLFSLRDALRRLKIEHPDEVDDELFEALQHMLNKEIRFLHVGTIVGLFWAYRKHKDDQELEISFQRLSNLIEESPRDEIRLISNKSTVITFCAIILNSGGWLIYVIPALILAATFTTAQMLVTKLIFGLSEKEVRTLFPDPQPATSAA